MLFAIPLPVIANAAKQSSRGKLDCRASSRLAMTGTRWTPAIAGLQRRMRAFILPALLVLLTAASPPELARWKGEAAQVTITRDDWGIAHVRGKTDADAVFGMIYAQAEDDFPRIEANYLTALGRTAEAEGEKAIWQDLRARLYVSPPELKSWYAKSPQQMQAMM
jgi:acyl-homoserine lactone acylase PvdQ